MWGGRRGPATPVASAGGGCGRWRRLAAAGAALATGDGGGVGTAAAVCRRTGRRGRASPGRAGAGGGGWPPQPRGAEWAGTAVATGGDLADLSFFFFSPLRRDWEDPSGGDTTRAAPPAGRTAFNAVGRGVSPGDALTAPREGAAREGEGGGGVGAGGATAAIPRKHRWDAPPPQKNGSCPCLTACARGGGRRRVAARLAVEGAGATSAAVGRTAAIDGGGVGLPAPTTLPLSSCGALCGDAYRVGVPDAGRGKSVADKGQRRAAPHPRDSLPPYSGCVQVGEERGGSLPSPMTTPPRRRHGGTTVRCTTGPTTGLAPTHTSDAWSKAPLTTGRGQADALSSAPLTRIVSVCTVT